VIDAYASGVHPETVRKMQCKELLKKGLKL
jgi:hypothetical protein